MHGGNHPRSVESGKRIWAVCVRERTKVVGSSLSSVGIGFERVEGAEVSAAGVRGALAEAGEAAAEEAAEEEAALREAAEGAKEAPRVAEGVAEAG